MAARESKPTLAKKQKKSEATRLKQEDFGIPLSLLAASLHSVFPPHQQIMLARFFYQSENSRPHNWE